MREVTHDIAYLRTYIVNVYLVGEPGAGDRGWTLVDTGMPLSAGRITAAARRRFGRNARPNGIVLTHGHFDHVGTVHELAKRWSAPVWAHPMELPYLTGQSDYPPPDPTVGGGLMALSSPLFPRWGIDLRPRVNALPSDGSVPGMPGWRSIHTPGHAPGHVSLWRESDRALIAGDAFTTTKQESLLAVATQWQKVHGPPAYYTIDWASARWSVEELAALEPEIGATGHGAPMYGRALRDGLRRLVAHWDEVALPDDGRYVRERAAWDAGGIRSVPPAVARRDVIPVALALGAAAAVGAAGLVLAYRASRANSGTPGISADDLQAMRTRAAAAQSRYEARRGKG